MTTLKSRLEEYLDKKVDAIQMIRELSGIFNPDHAVTLLAIICAITRHEQGDMQTSTFRRLFIDKREAEANDEQQ